MGDGNTLIVERVNGWHKYGDMYMYWHFRYNGQNSDELFNEWYIPIEEAAIDLLKFSEVDWNQVKNIEHLRKVLKL